MLPNVISILFQWIFKVGIIISIGILLNLLLGDSILNQFTKENKKSIFFSNSMTTRYNN